MTLGLDNASYLNSCVLTGKQAHNAVILEGLQCKDSRFIYLSSYPNKCGSLSMDTFNIEPLPRDLD